MSLSCVGWGFKHPVKSQDKSILAVGGGMPVSKVMENYNLEDLVSIQRLRKIIAYQSRITFFQYK